MNQLQILALKRSLKNLEDCSMPLYKMAYHNKETDELLRSNPEQFRETILEETYNTVIKFKGEAEQWISAILKDLEEKRS